MSEQLHYLALGDSYTIGEGVARAQSWPLQLAEQLEHAGYRLQPAWVIARTGWTTDELDAGIDAHDPQGRFDLVSLLIGVNNQFRGRPLAQYREQFAALLERAIALAGARPARVLVLSIPDWGVTPFAQHNGHDAQRVGSEIDRFNAAAAMICAERGVVFIDITRTSRALRDQPQMLVDDGLHPSATMYAHWVALTLPAARHALSSD